MANLVQYLEQNDFDVDCFVERLARQAMAGEAPETGEDARVLRAVFEQTLKDLAHEYEYQEERAQLLQKKCEKAEAKFHERARGILAHQQAARVNYKQARRQMNHIVAKTTYLGDMLEAHHIPRSRLMSHYSSIKRFEELVSNRPTSDSENDSRPVGLDYAKEILTINESVRDVYRVDYDRSVRNLDEEYQKVKADLLDQMTVAQRKGDIKEVRRIVGSVLDTAAYSDCVDLFIVNAQKKAFIHPDCLMNVEKLCSKVSSTIEIVFPKSEKVIWKFVDHVLKNRVANYVTAQLTTDRVDFLTTHNVYLARLDYFTARLQELCMNLSQLPMEETKKWSVQNFYKELLRPHLGKYQELEKRCMKMRLETLISAYYQSVGHQRKTAISPLRDKCSVIRRDVQSKINSKAATLINVAPSVKDFGGETYISEALAANTLQELREAFQRATRLLREPARSNLILSVWVTFLSTFVGGHLLYGINLGIKTIPVCQDLNEEPKQDFLRSVYQTNAIFYLIEDLYTGKVLPSLYSAIAEQRALREKLDHQEPLEDVIRVGLKRSVKAYANWISSLLDKQKPAEFLHQQMSPTAAKVVQFAKKCIEAFDEFLDGQNKLTVKMEFGRRFHKAVLRNIRRFHYSQDAGMGLLCDVMEYRAVVSSDEIPMLGSIFSHLQILCTLLVEPPERLLPIIEHELLNKIDAEIVKDFVQLREDCKSRKLLAILFQDSGP